MSAINLVLLVISIFFTISLVHCAVIIQRLCQNIPCVPHKINGTECKLHLVGDPPIKECMPVCTESCNYDYCQSCLCNRPDYYKLDETLAINCHRVLNIKDCNDRWCRKYESCPQYHVTHPYIDYECVLSCSYKSCMNGRCLPNGTCNCDLGYRLDSISGSICVKIPDLQIAQSDDDYDDLPESSINGASGTDGINSTSIISTDGTFPQNSDDCDHGERKSEGDCRCSNDYERNTITGKCELKRNSSDFTIPMDKMPVYLLSMSRNEEDVISDVPYMSYIAVLASLSALLLIATIVLVIVIIKMRRSIPRSDNGNNQSFAPNAKFQSKVNNGGVIVDNVELYGETY